MYWNQPLINCRWPDGPDPIPAMLGNNFLLFWNPEFDFRGLHTNQRLNDLCVWAMHGLYQGLDAFVSEESNHYDIANLVKLNIWAADIRRQGIVKPWLILDWEDRQEAGTGDSRLRLCEIMPEIATVPALISTHRNRANLYNTLEPVWTLGRLGELCGASPGQNFLFRGTDHDAPFGIYWYEFDSERTRAVTPAEDWCVMVFAKYYQQTCAKITAQWFLDPVDWSQFDKIDQ